MSNDLNPRWRVSILRADGSIEFDRLRLAHVRDIYKELKEDGKGLSHKDMELIVLEYVLKKNKESNIKSKIKKITLEPDKQ